MRKRPFATILICPLLVLFTVSFPAMGLKLDTGKLTPLPSATSSPIIKTPLFVPTAPSELTATIVSPTAIQLNWKDNSNTETGFNLTVHGGGYDMTDGIAANAVQQLIDYVQPGSTYTFCIYAYNSIGASIGSNTIVVEMSVPKTPISLSAVSTAPDAVQLTWSDVATNESGYVIERQSAGGTFSQIGNVGKNLTSYTDSGLQSGSIFTYRIAATNPVGTSTYSGNAGVTTLVAQASATPQPSGTPQSQSVDFSTASTWAVPEITEAIADKLIPDKFLSNFAQKITREEFCEIAVRLYEAISGKTALPSMDDPFNDSDNPEVLKAYNLGIVKGTSTVSFGPANLISRQEICSMIFRTLKAADPGVSTDISGVAPFTDESTIAGWALNDVRFASKHGIMKGTSNGSIAPLQKVTREQAIVLMKRTYDSFK